MSEEMNWTLLTIRLFGWVLNGFPALAGPPAVPQTAGLATTVPVDPGQLAAANYVGRGLTAPRYFKILMHNWRISLPTPMVGALLSSECLRYSW